MKMDMATWTITKPRNISLMYIVQSAFSMINLLPNDWFEMIVEILYVQEVLSVLYSESPHEHWQDFFVM